MTLKTDIIEREPGKFVAVVEGWWVDAVDRGHAERIVATARMAHSAGKRQARAEVRKALGLSAWGGVVRCKD